MFNYHLNDGNLQTRQIFHNSKLFDSSRDMILKVMLHHRSNHLRNDRGHRILMAEQLDVTYRISSNKTREIYSTIYY